uniref:Uncharacterized protein n=1 Tax=Salix viminalis TaxID=40686 RepID=A0A6N2KEH4_SALVM
MQASYSATLLVVSKFSLIEIGMCRSSGLTNKTHIPYPFRFAAHQNTFATTGSLTCSSGWQRPTERGERMAQKSTVSDLWSCCLDYLRIRGAVLGWTTDTAAARRRSNLSGLAVHSLPLRE